MCRVGTAALPSVVPHGWSFCGTINSISWDKTTLGKGVMKKLCVLRSFCVTEESALLQCLMEVWCDSNTTKYLKKNQRVVILVSDHDIPNLIIAHEQLEYSSRYECISILCIDFLQQSTEGCPNIAATVGKFHSHKLLVLFRSSWIHIIPWRSVVSQDRAIWTLPKWRRSRNNSTINGEC